MSGHRNEGQMLASMLDTTEKLRMDLGESLGLAPNASWAEIGEALEKKREPSREALRIKLTEMKGLPKTATWEDFK
jgi:hypothetical protein